jgi:uncharacterized membrane protein YjgN (DUF898 family)
MTTAEALTPSAGTVTFLGRESAYWRLRIKGALLVMVTLGIYRFWLATDVRRFLWSNTEIAGDSLEYNGLATELLVGFLLAIAILVPLYTAIAIAALEWGAASGLTALVGFLVLALLAEFAQYRARRYRLTRTVFRGLRFDQHGSAWRYALCALAWWCAVFLTLGLAYPWMQASLERFKMRHTSYGDLHGRFDGSGLSLFLRGLPLWLLVVGPLVGALIVLGTAIDWDAVANVMAKADDNAMEHLFETNPRLGRALVIAAAAAGAGIFALPLLYPLFQALLLRWWLSGIRFGAVAVASRLRIGQVYRVYFRFILYLLLFGLVALVVSLVGIFVAGALLGRGHDSSFAETAASAITVGLYVTTALGISVIHQVVVTAGLWRIGAQSSALSGIEALDWVRAEGAASSALGEGLADALGVGGI